MSLIVTKQLDPYYHSYSNRRTEFRLDTPNQLDADLRLMNLQTGIVAVDDIQYYQTVGVNGLIKQMRLYSGNILIDQTTDRHSLLCAWLNNAGSKALNSNQREIEQELLQNNNNYKLEFLNWNPNNNHALGFADALVRYSQPAEMIQDVGKGKQGYLSLKDYFQFLKAVGQGSGQSNFNLKDLRLVIEWNSTGDALSNNQNQFINVPQPVLVYDEYQGDQPPMNPAILFNGWELDRVVLPPVNNGAGQSEKFRVRGFNGKAVNSLFLAFAPQVIPANSTRGLYQSLAQSNEQFQIYWDNIPIYQEYVNSITKQLYLLDTMGDHAQLIGQDQFNKLHYDDLVKDARNQHASQSWGACDLQNLPITNLQISYSRTGNNALPWGTQAIELVVFGLVNKMVSISETGEIVLSYPLA